LYYAQTPRDLGYADMIILPGTKNSVADLTWLKQTGLAEEIRSLRGVVPILGICGGFQMLGKCIHDPEALEGEAGTHEALGLLDVETSFGRAKTTTLSYGEVVTPTELFPQGVTVRGYEIHAGVTTRFGRARAFIKVHLRDGTHVPGGLDDECDGAVNISGDVVGTYFHGLLDNDEMFAAFIESLFSRKALTPVLNRATRGPGGLAARCVAYDRLAQSVREHLDMAEIRRIAGI